MKEYLLHLTKYNRDADNKLVKILEGLSDEERKSDKKSYFVNLHGIVDHFVSSAIFLQKTIKASCPELQGLTHSFMEYPMEFGKVSFADFSELKNALQSIDNAMVEFVNGLTDADMDKTVTFRVPQRSMDYSLFIFVTMFITHGTHHRGQISQILDEMKIDNNYSSIAPQYE